MKKKINWQGKGQLLKKKLWEVFSIYIRRRDADKNGMVSCVTCGAKKHWKDLDAGHYNPKTDGLSMYFEEKNVHPQCTYCNRFRHGNCQPYALYLIQRYGPDILKELNWKKNQLTKITEIDYVRLIELYKYKIKELDGKETKV